jgi:hypothetical protein
MPLVLSGSTGIVEGNIADSAITNGKIASLAATKLTGQVPDANAPSGSVIQVIQGIGTTISVSSSTPTVVAQANITIQQGSKVFITACGDMNPDVTGNWHYYQIFRDSSAIGQRYIGQTSGASYNLPFSISCIETTGLNTGTYTYSLRGWQGSGTITYGETGDTQAPTIILMEIAA